MLARLEYLVQALPSGTPALARLWGSVEAEAVGA